MYLGIIQAGVNQVAQMNRLSDTLIAQYINVNGQGNTDFIANIDELIIQKRKERGLPLIWEDE